MKGEKVLNPKDAMIIGEKVIDLITKLSSMDSAIPGGHYVWPIGVEGQTFEIIVRRKIEKV